MEIQNAVLKNQIDKWISMLPVSAKIFEKYHFFIEIADRNSDYYHLTEEQLVRSIDGFIFLELSYRFVNKNFEKVQVYGNRGCLFLKPLIDSIIKHVKSDSYQDFIINKQITGEDILEINNVRVPINIKAIKLHSKRKNKLLLTRIDVEEIEKDFVNYKKELYKEPNIDAKLFLSSNLSNKKNRFKNIDLNKLDNLFVLELTAGIKPTILDKLKIDLSINIVNYNQRQIVAIASILFGYLHKNIKPKSFNVWLRQFSQIIDIQAPTTKKNAVKLEIEEFKKTYWYLNSL